MKKTLHPTRGPLSVLCTTRKIYIATQLGDVVRLVKEGIVERVVERLEEIFNKLIFSRRFL